MSQSIGSNSKILYYVDSSGTVWRDSNSSRLMRAIQSLWRDYNIFHVHTALKNAPSSLDKDFICSKVVKKCGITESQYRTMMSITTMSNPTEASRSLPKRPGEDFIAFLEEIRANKKFNKAAQALMKNGKDLSTISNKVLQEVTAFSHKTASEKEIVRVAKKSSYVMSMYFNKEPIVIAGGKLTLKDVKTLESAAKMKSFLDQVEKFECIESSSLKDLYAATQSSNKFIETFLEIAEKEDPSKAGTFIIYDHTTISALRSTPIPAFVPFIFRNFFKTNIGHISASFKDSDGKDMESHMWGSPIGKHVLSRRSLGNRCYKTIQLHPERMVDGRKMEDLWGPKWEERLNEKYTAICRSYFKTNPELKKLYNPRLRQILAGIGFRFSLSKQSWEERSAFPKNNRVVCSEFSVLASLQCLKRLNDEIKKQWEATYPDEEAPKINPPVRENRRLNRVIPHEIVGRTVHEGLADVMQPAPCILQVIDFKNDELIF